MASNTEVESVAGEILASVDRLRHETRARASGAWFPLLVFGLITLASIPLYRRPFDYPRGGAFTSGPFVTPYYAGLPGARSQALAYVFWLLVAPGGYLLCAEWYRRRARRLGVSFHWQQWVAAGTALFAMLVVVYSLPAHELGSELQTGWVELEGRSAVAELRDAAAAALSPLVAVAVGLLVLARRERSWVVAVAAMLYGTFTIVVNTYGLGVVPPWIVRPYGATHDFFFAPAHNVIVLTSFLLIGSVLTAARAQRVRVAT